MGCLNMMLCSFISKWMMHSGGGICELSLYCEITNLSDFYLGINSCFSFKEMWCIRHWRLSVANLPCSLLVTLSCKLSGENPVIATFGFQKITCALHAVEQVSAWGSSLTGSSTQLSRLELLMFWGSPPPADGAKASQSTLIRPHPPSCLLAHPSVVPDSSLSLSHFVWQPLSKFYCL